MRKNNLNSFYEKIAQDKELQSRVKPIIEKMKDSKNLDEIFKNELIPVAKLYGFELTLKDFLAQEAESKKSLSLDELEDVSGGIAAKPLMLTALTLFGLLGTGAAAMQAHAMDVPNQIEVVELSDSSDDENSDDELNDRINQLEPAVNVNNDNAEPAENIEMADAADEPNANENIHRNCAATVNGQEYESLESAIRAAKYHDTVVVENDVTVDHEIEIHESITIAARGQKTIKRAADYRGYLFNVIRGDLNIGDDNVQNCLIIDGGKIEGCKSLIVFNSPMDNTLNIKNAKLCNNLSDENGGAICFKAFIGNINISGQTEIFNNSARNGGAVFFDGRTDFNIKDDVKIHNNSAINNGGAFYFSRGNFNIFGQAKIFDNAAENGGAIYLEHYSSKLNIYQNAEIYNNNADRHGCGIYNKNDIGKNNIIISNPNQVHDNGGNSILDRKDTINLISDYIDSKKGHYRAQIRTITEDEAIIASGEKHEHEKDIALEDDPFEDFDLGPGDETREKCSICIGGLQPGDRVFECFASSEDKHITHLPCLLQVENHLTAEGIMCPVCRNEYHLHSGAQLHLPGNDGLRIIDENIYNYNAN